MTTKREIEELLINATRGDCDFKGLHKKKNKYTCMFSLKKLKKICIKYYDINFDSIFNFYLKKGYKYIDFRKLKEIIQKLDIPPNKQEEIIEFIDHYNKSKNDTKFEIFEIISAFIPIIIVAGILVFPLFF